MPRAAAPRHRALGDLSLRRMVRRLPRVACRRSRSRRRASELRFAWVDVEDEADAMGDVDIETFPTVLIAREGKPLFFGPVLPSGTQFTRLIASLRDTTARRCRFG